METLAVVTQRNWVANEFREALVPYGIMVKQFLGLDNPMHALGMDPANAADDAERLAISWWMPTEFAVRVLRVAPDLPLSAPGPDWLPEIPEQLSGRVVSWGKHSELVEKGLERPVFIKPAEFKSDELFPAQWREPQEVLEAIERFPAGSTFQWTETLLDIKEEHRFFVLSGNPVAGSVYLVEGTTIYDGASSTKSNEAWEFARLTAQTLAGISPLGYVLDVALLADGRWVVLEGNPAWSSALYDSDPADAYRAIKAACRHDPGFAWNPDPWLLERSLRQRELP